MRVVALDTALRHALAQAAADTSRAGQPARRATVYALLAQEAAALAVVQASFDSLKAALTEAPPLLPAAMAAATAPTDTTATAPTDTAAAPNDAWRRLPPARSPWAVLALAETTPSWSTLPVRTPGDDRERLQASLTQSLQLQRQLGARWLVRAGLGQLTTQRQVRRTSERSGETVVRDSSATTDIVIRITESTSEIVHLDSVMQLDPLTNLSGQIIGYDTTWASTNDTLRSTIIGRDTLRITRHEITTRTETWRETRQQLFRPQYRFWTLPLGVQYQLMRTNRWTLGVNLGGQVTIFRGGERPVWTGEDYALRRVSARESGYRPVSFSASAGLEAAYRLSPRLTALVAPTVRGWVVQPGRGETATQPLLPALQVGLTYGF
ncbi:MAG: hypothetical protein H7330_11065 [Hymenobacteraceae bacterium]|nr:hypothetical protein [Hymenobacteraceae bacterium]